MTSEKKIWSLRFAEKTLVALILLLVIGGVWELTINPDIHTSLMQLGIMALGVLLLILLILQNFVDKVFDRTIQSANKSDNEKFLSLYERSPTPHVTIDGKGDIIMFNPAAVKLFEATTDALMRRHFFDFVLEHSGHDVSMLPNKISHGMVINEEELRLGTLKEGEIWVLMSVYEDAETDHHIISLTDITQSKKIDTAKSEFVALATHQLRTPVAAIKWNLELLQKKMRDIATEDHQRYLTKISRNTYRMVALIDDFLSVSKLEMGTYATSEENVNLSEFIDGVLDEFAEKITEKQITVKRDQQPEKFNLVTDGNLFHIIVSNLTSNAVKYLQTGGNLTISYRASGNKLVIQVSDNGIGIPQAELPNLFTKFFRASNARSHQTDGTGLGLYIVKQSVEQLGGTIEVTSTENILTTFTVTLPVSG